MLAEIDWAVLIPGTISSFTGLITTLFVLLTHKRVRVIEPKVTAIDHAVNGQPVGTKHLVDKVSDINREQDRVRDELERYKEDGHSPTEA